MKAAKNINNNKLEGVARKVFENIKEKFEDRKMTVGIPNLAYKQNIDAFRKSLSFKISNGQKERVQSTNM